MALAGTTVDGTRAQGTVAGSTTITHTGSTLQFGSFVIDAPEGTAELPMGSATVSANDFDGTVQFDSPCGMTTSHYRGWFNADGSLMNMTLTITSPRQGCNTFEIRGEMSR